MSDPRSRRSFDCAISCSDVLLPGMAVGDSCTGVDVHDLTANEHYITWKWTPLVMGSFSCHQVASVTIETRYVLSVRRLEASRTCCSIGVLSRNANEVGLIVQCVCKLNSGLWRIQTWNAIGPSKEVDSYYHRIKLYRELSIPYRPRSLLVFINPYGGKKLAELIFYSTVRPIFNLAGIRTKVIVTTHQGHCENFMLMEDLHSYDGVVAVGGDGLFSELLQGLLYRTRTDAKLPLYKQHKPFTSEVTPQLRIGLIPAGSTNAVIRSIHGTEDVETAAIHIALGFDIGVDVLGIHESSTKAFLRYTVSLLGYGFHGDILEPSERLRWLGPPRYDIAGAIKWLKLASYKCRITYLPSTSSTPFDENICGSSCPVCLKLDRDYEEATQAVEADQSNKSGEARQAAGPATQPHPTTSSLMDPPSLCSQSPHSCSAHPQDDLNVEEAAEMVDDLLLEVTGAEGGEEWGSEERKLKGGWRVITGDFVAVNAFLISCRCAKSPLGPAPTAHLGDGFLDLILVHQCSRLQYLRYLFHLTNQRKERHSQHLRMPFIKAHRVRAFQFQALNRYGDPVVYEEAVGENTSVWCVDGEILRNPNIICCVHRQLIRMYGRGPEL